MIDTNGFNVIQKGADKAKALALANQWLDAGKYSRLTLSDVYSQTTRIDFFNILTKVNPSVRSTEDQGINFLLE